MTRCWTRPITDNRNKLMKAIKAAQAIEKRTGVAVTWRDVLNPHGAAISVKVADQGEAADVEGQEAKPVPITGGGK